MVLFVYMYASLIEMTLNTSHEEEEPKKKRLKDASVSDSNTLPPDYTTPDKGTETDLDSMARCKTKSEELESTCESSIQSKLDSP
uniref:Uncharacterized protein n=1 Tax=Tanacetum cinerariifolium TaxID=118510 RepID=A0A6L2NNQ1_TANCI|nr:hypothetical protein [Tanacetum cinerariifolium]